MRVRCHKLNPGIQSAVFFWEEDYVEADKFGNPVERKRKQFLSVAQDEEFDVKDDVGHTLLSRYKDNLRVIHYGDPESPTPVTKKMAAAPKNAMVKEEKDK